jgi:YD repeat-containing protein
MRRRSSHRPRRTASHKAAVLALLTLLACSPTEYEPGDAPKGDIGADDGASASDAHDVLQAPADTGPQDVEPDAPIDSGQPGEPPQDPGAFNEAAAPPPSVDRPPPESPATILGRKSVNRPPSRPCALDNGEHGQLYGWEGSAFTILDWPIEFSPGEPTGELEGRQTYGYDERGRLLTQTHVEGGQLAFHFTWQRSDDGNLVAIDRDLGQEVNGEIDERTEIQEVGPNTWVTRVIARRARDAETVVWNPALLTLSVVPPDDGDMTWAQRWTRRVDYVFRARPPLPDTAFMPHEMRELMGQTAEVRYTRVEDDSDGSSWVEADTTTIEWDGDRPIRKTRPNGDIHVYLYACWEE